jgi:SlyX protein
MPVVIKEPVMDELRERIVELEIRYTHQADLIEELNVELTHANKRIDQLEREAKVVRDMLGRLQPEMTESPDE